MGYGRHSGRARGIRGELTAITFSKPERYENLREVFLFPEGVRHEVESAWFHDNRLILKFRGVDTMSDAERLTGREVRVPRGERIHLEPGEFFEADLIGCEVVERDGGASLGPRHGACRMPAAPGCWKSTARC